jgi:hypothetical protein
MFLSTFLETYKFIYFPQSNTQFFTHTHTYACKTTRMKIIIIIMILFRPN